MSFAQSLQLCQVLHDPLELWVVKPGHFDYLCQQNYDHLQDFLVALWALLTEIADHVLLNDELLFYWYLRPVYGE